MPRLTLTTGLLAALALAPARAVAGPPERLSGRMVLDEVAEGLMRYRMARTPEVRARQLARLAPKGDPRVAVAVGEALSDPSPEVTSRATRIIADHYDMGIQDISGDQYPYAVLWWVRHQADLRRRAALLPR
jgi:hypothetical protein